MKNKFLKAILTITAAVSCWFMFSSFSPSLDGRAIVVEEGVFPQGLFAKTVGYLPGDIISVTNISGEKTVDILVIGALDPSEGVAIMLSPEAANAIGIGKTNSNIVKITKRSGQDERVYGSAVIARQMSEFPENESSDDEEDFEKDEKPSIPYISYEDDYSDVNVIPPADTVQVSATTEKDNADTSYFSVNPSDTSVYNQTSTYPLLTSAEISAIKGGVSDIDRKSLKESKIPEQEENSVKKEEEIYSALNLSKEILDIPNAKSSKVDTADNINLDEVSVDNTKNNKGYDAPQIVPASETITSANDSKDTVSNQNVNPVYSEPLYEDKAEAVKEEPLPEELVLLDDLESVSKVCPDSYDEQEAVIGSYGISRKPNTLEEEEVPPPFDEGEAQKRVYTESDEIAGMYTANQPKTEIPSLVPFEEEEVLPEDESESIEQKESAESADQNEADQISDENKDSQEVAAEENNEENLEEAIQEEGLDTEENTVEENVEVEQEVNEAIQELEEALPEEKVELDTLEEINENAEIVEEETDSEEQDEDKLVEEAVKDEIPDLQELVLQDDVSEEVSENQGEIAAEEESNNDEIKSDGEGEIEEEILLEDELPEESYDQEEPDVKIETEEPLEEDINLAQEDEYSAELPDFTEEEVVENKIEDTELVEIDEPELQEEKIEDSDKLAELDDDVEELDDDLDEVIDDEDFVSVADEQADDSASYGNLDEVKEDFEDSLFFVEDEFVKDNESEAGEPVYLNEILSDADTADKDFVEENLPSKDIAEEKELNIPEEIVEDFDDADGFTEEEIPETVKDLELDAGDELAEDSDASDYEEFSAITLVPAEDNPPVVENIENSETDKTASEKSESVIGKSEVEIKPVTFDAEKIETDELDDISSFMNADSSKTDDSDNAEKEIAVNDGKERVLVESKNEIADKTIVSEAKSNADKTTGSKITSYEKFLVSGSEKLVSGKYYIQIATVTKDESVLEIVNKYSAHYPLAVIPLKNGSKQVLIGPLTVDEYGTVLERFKSYGYKDAFLKKIK